MGDSTPPPSSPPSVAFPQEIDIDQIYGQINTEQKIAKEIVIKTLGLMKEGSTVPFIARYRKEVTGALNEIQLRALQKQYETLVSIEERKLAVLRLIDGQGKLTMEVRDRVLHAVNLQEIEDLYLPFKPKYKTLGAKAREKGLGPLADLIRQGVANGTADEIVQTYINADKGVPDAKEALDGAVDIIAEDVGNDPDSRQYAREVIVRRAVLKSKVNQELLDNFTKEHGGAENGGDKGVEKGDKEPESVPVASSSEELGKKKVDPFTFKDYFDFTIDTTQLQPHQILALNRAEDCEVLNIDFDTPDELIIHDLKRRVLNGQNEKTSVLCDYYAKGIEAGYKRYIHGAIKREHWRLLREKAEDHSIKVFAKNLKQLLMTPPIKGRAIIGLDPGYRTGCKVAVVDPYGKFLDHTVIYPSPPKNQKEQAKKILLDLAQRHRAYTFAIGNGTASRETELFIADLIQEHKKDSAPFEYAIVSEAGASIYSASELAHEEFPDLDATVRGAISIARRLQDPLSELIKIDPKSIGVGMYQHDVNQTSLKAELDAVIEDCVNGVGVDLNTASSKLLEYVSGMNKSISKGIVAYRNENGPFGSRKDMMQVKGMGPKTFEQSAGFLKIREAVNPLDSTFVHPESYDLAEKVLAEVDLQPKDLIDQAKRKTLIDTLLNIKPNAMARKYGVDADRIRFLVELLSKPDLDPRDSLGSPLLRKDVMSIDDLKAGMIVKGTVRNVVDFGAFVDIGVKINGLVHKSQIANQYVKNPQEFLAVGQVMDFMITGIDKEHKRIQLSLKQVPKK